ncbi:MAG TPA: TlpA disulfide reductase family protein [Candidatus Saccharimonadales bacterium]|nr:TlpA disulfide reductase family protein [Candidatus Saccharimonadales bacterium]
MEEEATSATGSSRLAGLLLLPAAIGLALAACSAPSRPSGGWTGAPGSPAPDFGAPDLNGKSWRLADATGSAVLVNLWATWCDPCREEIPDLVALYGREKARGLEIVGVSIDSTDAGDAVRDFVADHGIPYLVLHDGEGRSLSAFGVEAVPVSFLFNKKGLLVWSHRGPIDPEDPSLNEALDNALGS